MVKKNRLGAWLSFFVVLVMIFNISAVSVLASDDDPEGETGGVVTTLGELTEDVVFQQDNLAYEQTISFTPETTAKYTFMATNALYISVAVTDEYGTTVLPAKSDITDWTVVYDLQLQAGKTYIFTMNASYYGYEKPFTLYIRKAFDHVQMGDNDFLMKDSSGEQHYSFTPDESGMYFFTLSAEGFLGRHTNFYISVYEGEAYISQPFTSPGHTNLQAAILTAGKTYDVRIAVDGAGQYFYDLVHLNISNDLIRLEEGTNTVTTSFYSTDWYSFTPSQNGVYAFYSQGDFNTSVDQDAPNPKIEIFISKGSSNEATYGFGRDNNNFILREVLEAGTTYYIRLSEENGAESTTFPVVIEKLSEYGAGENAIPAGEYETVYYPFRADSDAYYVCYADAGSLNVRSYLGADSIPSNTKGYYRKAGQVLLLNTDNNSGTDHINFAIWPITQTLGFGDNTLAKKKDNHAYAVFTPSVTGVYNFTVDCEEGFENAYLYQTDGYSPNRIGGSSGGAWSSYYLIAGEPYLFDAKLNSGASEQMIVAVEAENLSSLQLGVKNTIYKATSDWTYTFTPEKTGFYQFYNSEDVEMSIRAEDYNYELVQEFNDYSTGLRMKIYPMKAGQEYTIQVEFSYYGSYDMVDLYVAELSEMYEGRNEISKPATNTLVQFTPSKTGIYSFDCVDGDVQSMYWLPSFDSSSYSWNVPTYYGNGKRYALLEKGVTYIVPISAESNHTSDYFDVTIDSLQKLETKKNENVLVENLNGYGSHYTFYSFTPEESGTYCFQSDKNNGYSVSGILYKGLDTYTEIGRGGGSYYDGNMTMTATLEAGEIYWLWMYTDQSEQDLDIDLNIEYVPAGKLAGYSLSLDGSIAINLYLSLADYVVKSDTAVLKYTRADGSVVEYKIKEATKKTVNNIEYYVFHLPIAAKEMTKLVYAQIVDEEKGIASEEFCVEAADYAMAVIQGAYDNYGHVKNQEYADAIPLVKALLNYAGRAQTYFKYNQYDLAYDYPYLKNSADRVLGSLSTDSIPHFVRSEDTSLPDGLVFEGASLTIDSETALTFYFTNNTGKALTFTDASSVQIESKQSGGYTTVKVTGIPAHKLDKKIRLNVQVAGDPNIYFVDYSPMYYCYNVLSRDTTATRTDALKDLMKAFYFYNQAAKNYFGED